MGLSFADYLVFGCYLVAVVTLGLLVARKQKDTVSDYFKASDKLPWYALGFSLVAASISSEQFVGEVGYAYRYGLAVATWEWSTLPAVTIMMLFFIPFYLRRYISTMPQYLDFRFGKSTRVVFALITVLSCAFINLAGVFYTGGLTINEIFGINIWVAILILAACGGLLTVAGGLASVVWTDILQTTLLLGGGLVVFFVGLVKAGGWHSIIGTGERAHMILPANHPALPWTGMLVLFFSTNTFYYASNQYINQRLLGAKNEWHARAGILFASFLGIFLTLAVCFPGLVAYKLFPGMENPDKAYPKIVKELIGPIGWGLRGLVLAGLAGAIMSTIESLITSCATILTFDFYKNFLRKDATEKSMVLFGRLSTIVVLAVGVACSRIVASWGSIFTYFQDLWFFMAVPIVVVFVSAILWKRANNFSATITLLLCVPLMFFVYLKNTQGWLINWNNFNLAGLFLIPVTIIHVLLAYCAPPPAQEQVDKYMWKPSMLYLPAELTAKQPWYKNLVFLWVILFLIYLSLFIKFR